MDQEVIVRVASEAEGTVKVATVVVMIVAKARKVVRQVTSTPPSVVVSDVVAVLLLHLRRWSTTSRYWKRPNVRVKE